MILAQLQRWRAPLMHWGTHKHQKTMIPPNHHTIHTWLGGVSSASLATLAWVAIMTRSQQFVGTLGGRTSALLCFLFPSKSTEVTGCRSAEGLKEFNTKVKPLSLLYNRPPV